MSRYFCSMLRAKGVWAALPLLLPVAAAAQNVPSSTGAKLEEVVVTATKRESTVQELPFSLNVQSEADIQRSNFGSLEDLSRSVAGLSIQNLGPGQSQVAIRGVSAGQIIRDQPGVKEQVGIYLDETVISLSLFTPDLDLYDLNRVETLRGPQGTLFGAGSIGGTIRYITNQPTADTLEGSLEANVNAFDGGSEGGHLKGMLNIPLSDSLALRAVAYHTRYAGFIDALGENATREQDVNEGERTGARVALRWDVSDRLTITPRVLYQELESDGYNRQEVYNLFANPYTTTRPAIQLGDREQYLLRGEQFRDETLIADVTANLAFNGVDMTYIGSYLDRDILASRDSSALIGSVSVDLGWPDDLVTLPANLRDQTDLEQTSHELRLSSSGAGGIQWLIGAFYADMDRGYGQRLPTPGYDAAVDAIYGDGTSDAVRNGFDIRDSAFNSDVPYAMEQYAVFGEVEVPVGDRLSVTLGGRFYDFEETRTITNGGFLGNGDTNIVDDTASDGFNGRLMASYALRDDVSLNAQVSQGFRLGGVNDPLNVNVCNPEDLEIFGGFQSYDDETLWNYELGLKSSFQRFRLNTAVFYTDIEDLQVTLDAGSCSSRISFNVPEAHTLGAELELTAFVTDSIELSLAGSVVEAEFDTTVRDASGSILGGVEKGNRVASVPEWQLALTGTYTLGALLGASDSYINIVWQAVGSQYTQPSDQVPGAGSFQSSLPFGGATGQEVTQVDLKLDSYQLINLNFGLIYDDIELVAYIRNLSDENALLSFDRERGGRARLGYRVSEPRSIGLTARYRF